MISSVIDFFLVINRKIDNVIIFATDQTDIKYQITDTIIEGEIIQKVLKEKYNIKSQLRKNPLNPSDYDAMMKWFEADLIKINDSYSKTQNDLHYYCLCSGGVPACITAMLFNGIKILKENFIPYYKSEAYNTPVMLQITSIISGEFEKQQINIAKENFDFNALVSLYSGKSLEIIAKTLLALYNNDFDSANNMVIYIDNANDILPDIKQSIIDYIIQKNSIIDLLYKIEIKAKRNEYFDFLLYVSIASEIILKNAVEKKIPDVDISNEPKFEKCMNKNYSAVINEIEKYPEFDGKFVCKPSKLVLAAILKYFAENKNDAAAVKLYNFYKRLEFLIGLRNNITHRLTSITKENIEKSFDGKIEDIILLIRETIEVLLNVNTPSNFYTAILIRL